MSINSGLQMPNIEATNGRLIIGTVDQEARTKYLNQKEGISCLKGLKARLQKSFGFARDIIINGNIYTVNNKSLNKWIARTTYGSSTNKLSKDQHDAISKALNVYSDPGHVILVHAEKQDESTAIKTDFIQNVPALFYSEGLAYNARLVSSKKEAAIVELKTEDDSKMDDPINEVSTSSSENEVVTELVETKDNSKMADSINEASSEIDNLFGSKEFLAEINDLLNQVSVIRRKKNIDSQSSVKNSVPLQDYQVESDDKRASIYEDAAVDFSESDSDDEFFDLT